jgi:hypothetical protein
VKTVVAQQFVRTLSGTKRPCLFLCSDETGAEIEVVIKFREGVTGNVLGLVSEAICAQLGSALDLSVPEAYFVQVRANMGEFISDESYAQVVNASVGVNFGSRLVPPGFATVPTNDDAFRRNHPIWPVEVFAHDFLTQNFDRQQGNHNLLFNGTQYYLIDHEQALQRVYRAPALEPGIWEVDPLYRHIFYPLLDLATDWSTFYRKYRNIPKQQIEMWFRRLPAEWLVRPVEVDKIKGYLLWLRDHLDEMDSVMKGMI